MPFLIAYTLVTLEYFVFSLDVLCSVWFLVRIGWQFLIEVKDATA